MLDEKKKRLKEKLLYVEGPNDMWVTISLRQQYSHEEDVVVDAKEGCEQALMAFSLKISNPTTTKRLGLIIDADTDINARYAEIIKELRETSNLSIDVSELANNNGLIKEIKRDSGDIIKIGIWIMPNNMKAGRIEDFLFEKIEEDNKLFKQVEPLINTLEQNAEKDKDIVNYMYLSKHRDKAKLHTFMAWSNPPDLSMGMAVKKGFFPVESETEKKFRAWIENLFL